MRARNIKPGFWENEELSELPFEGRLLFIGLWCLADRNGVLEDRPKRIKGHLFRYDDISTDAISRMLCDCENLGFISRYEVDGIKLIHINNFVKHQSPHHTEAKPTLPTIPPKGIHREVTVDSPLVHREVTVDSPLQHGGFSPDSLNPDSLNPDSLNPDCGFTDSNTFAPTDGENAPPSSTPEAVSAHKRVKLNLTTHRWEGITPQDMEVLKQAYPACCITTELNRMAEWVKANPSKRKSNWYRFLTNWLSRSQDKGGSGRHPPGTMQRDGPMDGILSKSGQATARNMAAIIDLERKANERH